jgi:hypothetical protein
MALPYLYRKLLEKYGGVDRHYQNTSSKWREEVASTFRISQTDTRVLLKELDKMGKIKEKTQRRFKLQP